MAREGHIQVKMGEVISALRKAGKKMGLAAFNNQLIRVYSEYAVRLFLRAAQPQDKMQQTS